MAQWTMLACGTAILAASAGLVERLLSLNSNVYFYMFNIKNLVPPHSPCVTHQITLYVFYTPVRLLQFNSLRTQHLHSVRRRTCLIQTRSSVRSFTYSSVSLVCQTALASLSAHPTHQVLQPLATYAAYQLHQPYLVVRWRSYF